ncbi:MAG: hypothetical protein KAJ18_12625 [Candidatus Omnitrophica bacterium]|nr:hypothetical protein [Candidatus Omnitrophota bacterium]
MPFNLVGFSEATPGTGTPGIAPGGNEQLYRVAGDDLYVTVEAPYVIAFYAAVESTPTTALLRQAKMIDYDFTRVMDLNVGNKAGGYTYMFGRPLPLRVDKLQALTVNATDEDTLIGVWLSSGKITQAMLDEVNPTHKIYGYGDTTQVVNSWTHIPITWTETLDAGIYEIVGMRGATYLSTNMTALMRLSIPGSQSWKPGVVCQHEGSAHAKMDSDFMHRVGADWPLMGISFDTEHLPNVETLSPVAHTDQDVELTLQKVG